MQGIQVDIAFIVTSSIPITICNGSTFPNNTYLQMEHQIVLQNPHSANLRPLAESEMHEHSIKCENRDLIYEFQIAKISTNKGKC